jgi:hypothetical protein
MTHSQKPFSFEWYIWGHRTRGLPSSRREAKSVCRDSSSSAREWKQTLFSRFAEPVELGERADLIAMIVTATSFAKVATSQAHAPQFSFRGDSVNNLC